MSAEIDAIIALYRELLNGGPVMYDRALNPIPDIVIEPGGLLQSPTPAGTLWLLDRLQGFIRDVIRDAQDDGLLVEDRR